MDERLLTISERGQVTIPGKLRKKIKAKYLICCYDGNNIILQPVQTKEEFFEELEERSKNWEKDGKGVSLEEMEKKYLK